MVLKPVCRDLDIDWWLDCWGDSCKAEYRITCSGNMYRVVAYTSDYHIAYVDRVGNKDSEGE
jgi:hypothetical protein